MSERPAPLPSFLGLCAMALFMLVSAPQRRAQSRRLRTQQAERAQPAPGERPFGEPRSSEEPLSVEQRRAREPGRGRSATHPLQIPWAGWKDILWRSYAGMNANRLLAIAGGVAFFVLLAIFPAVTALVSAYDLFFNAATMTNHLSLMQDVVPDNVLGLVREQGERAASHGGTLSIGIVAGMLVALWSAMSGVKAVIDALNVIYEQREGRSFVKLNAVALMFTLGGFAGFLVVVAAVVVLPLVLSSIGLAGATATLTRALRWPALFVILLVGLSVLYRYAPDRRTPRWQWVSVGSLFATLTWIAASYLFSWFLANFANYNATYGSLGAAVGLMMWLWISTIVVLLGAELNAQIERQTARDSTVGAKRPLGSRGAVAADTVGAGRP
jgi:membrane protein